MQKHEEAGAGASDNAGAALVASAVTAAHKAVTTGGGSGSKRHATRGGGGGSKGGSEDGEEAIVLGPAYVSSVLEVDVHYAAALLSAVASLTRVVNAAAAAKVCACFRASIFQSSVSAMFVLVVVAHSTVVNPVSAEICPGGTPQILQRLVKPGSSACNSHVLAYGLPQAPECTPVSQRDIVRSLRCS
jgi:hypothetical protein